MSPGSEPIGLVIGTEDAFALHFWVYVHEGRFLQLDDVVTVPVALPGEAAEVRVHGIVDTVRSRFEGARYDSDAFAAAEERLPVGVAHAAHVTVTRVEPEIFVAPPPGTPVYKSEAGLRSEALYFDRMLEDNTAFRAGVSRDGQPVYGNLEFLDGTRGAHMNISGISGVATKTSYALFLLYSLFHGGALGSEAHSTKAVVFNVKGEDLMWLDKPNSRLTPADRDRYAALGLPVGPFQSVGIWSPVMKGDTLIHSSKTRAEGVTAYAWSLSTFVRERMLGFLFAEGDNETSRLASAVRAVERWLDNAAIIAGPDARGRLTFVPDGSEIRDFGDLALMIDINKDAAMPSESEQTRQALIRRLNDAQYTAGHLVRAMSSEEEARHQVQVLDTGQNRQVNVIDINDLHDRAKRFVVGAIVKKLVEAKEGRARPLVFLVLDELNKYAPREGWSPIKEVILDIAERGRSLGVILIGAQQTASEIERRVTANASFRVVGRLDAAEAGRGEYGFLPDAARARASIFKPGTMFVHQPEIPVPLLVQFPFPAWATRRDEVLDGSAADGSGLRSKGG